MLTSILPQIAIAVLACAAAVYLATAKRPAPISRQDANILWKLHKLRGNCKGNKWEPIEGKAGEVTGFVCQCGYSYAQKKPLLRNKAASPALMMSSSSSFSSRSSVQLDGSKL